MLSKSVKRQAVQIFENVDVLFSSFDQNDFEKKLGGFVVWKQFYHLVHSIDKNFIDPSSFVEPSFHIEDLDIIYLESEKCLSRTEILDYYNEVRVKIERYLNEITDEFLEYMVKFRGQEFSRLDLILAQFRHIFFHVGYLHCVKKIDSGQTPEYVGLYKAREK